VEQKGTQMTCPDHFELLVPLGGHGRIHWRSESMPYNSGEAWLFPAAPGEYQLVAQSATKLLRTYVPDLEQFSHELAENGISDSQRSATATNKNSGIPRHSGGADVSSVCHRECNENALVG
jgi:hypothetical protein